MDTKLNLVFGFHVGSRIKRVSNMVKMLSAVLKFIVDASTMELVSHSQTRCLNFTLEYLEFIISGLRQHSRDHLQFKEDELKETFLCVKSSFTYATKLLNLVLKGSSETSPPQPEAYILSNKLLDLNISVEEHMGSGYAARIVAAAKPWLPDLILGLGSWNILKQSPRKSTRYFGPAHVKSSFPAWPTILAKVELIEIGSEGGDDDTVNSGEFPAFRKFVGMMIQLLRANHDVLDAVGVIFLTGSIVGLERKDFQLVLGLMHFVCAKLVGHNNREWGELKMMLESLQDIYPQIEREAEEPSNGEDGQQKLQSARELLEPIWMCHIFETGREPMEEE